MTKIAGGCHISTCRRMFNSVPTIDSAFHIWNGSRCLQQDHFHQSHRYHHCSQHHYCHQHNHVHHHQYYHLRQHHEDMRIRGYEEIRIREGLHCQNWFHPLPPILAHWWILQKKCGFLSKSSIFRFKFHGILPELREIAENCRNFVNFAEKSWKFE